MIYATSSIEESLEVAKGNHDGCLGIIGYGKFSEGGLKKTLLNYLTYPKIKVIREILLGETLIDPIWKNGVKLCHKLGFFCELELSLSHLSKMTRFAEDSPDISFIITNLCRREESFAEWKKEIKNLSKLGNVAIKICDFEKSFGEKWNFDTVRPWVLETIELFTDQRAMFGSGKAGQPLLELYRTYGEIVKDLSHSEKENLFRHTALKWYHIAAIF